MSNIHCTKRLTDFHLITTHLYVNINEPFVNSSTPLESTPNVGKSNAQAITSPTKFTLGTGAGEMPWNSTALQLHRNPLLEDGTLNPSAKIPPRSAKNTPSAHKIAISGNSYFLIFYHIHTFIFDEIYKGLFKSPEPLIFFVIKINVYLRDYSFGLYRHTNKNIFSILAPLRFLI